MSLGNSHSREIKMSEKKGYEMMRHVFLSGRFAGFLAVCLLMGIVGSGFAQQGIVSPEESGIIGDLQTVAVSQSLADYYPEIKTAYDDAARTLRQLEGNFGSALNRARRTNKKEDWMAVNQIARQRVAEREKFMEVVLAKKSQRWDVVTGYVQQDRLPSEYRQVVSGVKDAELNADAMEAAVVSILGHKDSLMQGQMPVIEWPPSMEESLISEFEAMLTGAVGMQELYREAAVKTVLNQFQFRAGVARQRALDTRSEANAVIETIRVTNQKLAAELSALFGASGSLFINAEANIKDADRVLHSQSRVASVGGLE